MPDTPPEPSPREQPTLVNSGKTPLDGPLTPLTLDLPVPSSRGFQALPVEQHVFATRYTQRGVIGEGGMGEVRLVHDSRIGRDVALNIRKPGAGTGG